MAIRTSEAEWRGDLTGRDQARERRVLGQLLLSLPLRGGHGHQSRRADRSAHAGCFSMALSAALAEAGHPPTKIHTAAKAHLGPVPGGFAISRIDLVTEGSVPGIDAETFGRRDL